MQERGHRPRSCDDSTRRGDSNPDGIFGKHNHLSHFVGRPRTPMAQPLIRRPMYQAPRRAVCRTNGRTHQDTTHAPIAKCSRLISAGKA
jgi:hypothetical protein